MVYNAVSNNIATLASYCIAPMERLEVPAVHANTQSPHDDYTADHLEKGTFEEDIPTLLFSQENNSDIEKNIFKKLHWHMFNRIATAICVEWHMCSTPQGCKFSPWQIVF